MAIGKRRAAIARVIGSDLAASLADAILGIGVVDEELAVAPGYATIQTSVAIAAGKAVNLNNKLLRLADAATNIPAVGICINGAASGGKARIILGMGYLQGLTGLTANSNMWLGNAGAIVYVKPGAGFIQGLGYTLSTTEMFVMIGSP